jgi:hypothetical protein
MDLCRDHLLVQDAHDEYFPSQGNVEHDVLPMFVPVEASMNWLAASSDGWAICEKLETLPQVLRITLRLGSSPGLDGESNNGLEVGLS